MPCSELVEKYLPFARTRPARPQVLSCAYLDATVDWRGSGLNMVSDKSRSWPVWGLNTDVFTDGSRTRIARGHGHTAVAVADWTRLWPVGRTLPDAFQPLHEHCTGNCVDDSPDAVRSINWTPTWTLRVRQMNCFADSSGNCPDVSRLLRQLLCGHSPVLREMLPGNCSDTARKLPGHCSCDSPDVARTFRGH